MYLLSRADAARSKGVPRVLFPLMWLDFSAIQFISWLFKTRGGIFQKLLASADYSQSKDRLVLRVFEKYQRGWPSILIFDTDILHREDQEGDIPLNVWVSEGL